MPDGEEYPSCATINKAEDRILGATSNGTDISFK